MKLTIKTFSKETSNKFPYSNYILYHFSFIPSNTSSSYIQDKIITSQLSIPFRYSELNILNDYLIYKYSPDICKSNSPSFPSKSLFQSDTIILQRKKALETYFNYLFTLINNRNIQNDLRNFILRKINHCLYTKSSSPRNSNDKDKSTTSFETISTSSNNSSHFSNSSSQSFSSSSSSINEFTLESDFITAFLMELNTNKENISTIIKKFQEDNRDIFTGERFLEKDEIYKLFFGQNNYLNGLIYYITEHNNNKIGRLTALEFVYKLINYENNHSCDLYRRILQLITRSKVNELHLQELIINYNCNLTIMMCYELVKCLCEQDEYMLEDFFNDAKLISNYKLFVSSQTHLY